MQQHARVAHGVAPLLLPARWQPQRRDAVRDPRALLQLLGLAAHAASIPAAASAQFPLRGPGSCGDLMHHVPLHRRALVA
ncbi:hypothetical protein P2D06_15485, partial [Xanthomonas perforans]